MHAFGRLRSPAMAGSTDGTAMVCSTVPVVVPVTPTSSKKRGSAMPGEKERSPLPSRSTSMLVLRKSFCTLDGDAIGVAAAVGDDVAELVLWGVRLDEAPSDSVALNVGVGVGVLLGAGAYAQRRR